MSDMPPAGPPPPEPSATGVRAFVMALLGLPMRMVRWVTAVVVGTTRHAIRDDITGVASQFAYNAFLATVPFLFVLVSLIGLVAEPDTFDSFLAEDADNAIPPELRDVLRTALAQATANTGQAAAFLALGLLGAIYVSANVMGALVGGLDRARGVPHRRWLRGKLVAAALALGTSVLVVATTLALIGGSRLVDAIAQEIFGRGAPNVASDLLYGIGAASLLIFTVTTFHLGPNAPRRRFIADVPGAVVSVVLWLGASRLFALYIENFDSYKTVYGALAGAAIYLIFLFLTCVALLIGAEVNEQMARMRALNRDIRAAAARAAAERAAQEAPHRPAVTLVPVEPPTEVLDAEAEAERLRRLGGDR
jgi:membrane protein